MVSKKELKFIKSLKVKKYRAREKRFVVEGAKNVLELINSDYSTDFVLCSKNFHEDHSSELKDLRLEIVSDKILEETGSFQSNNSCIAVAQIPDRNLDETDLNKQTFVLDGVSDPGNLGTIIRTLDWFGFTQLICSEDSADLYNPKVINSTMGSFTRVRTFHVALDEFFQLNKLPVYGAEMNGSDLFKTKVEMPSVIVMGSESHGISREVQSKLDFSLTIPGTGDAESLNVGIATGIIAGYLRMF